MRCLIKGWTLVVHTQRSIIHTGAWQASATRTTTAQSKTVQFNATASKTRLIRLAHFSNILYTL